MNNKKPATAFDDVSGTARARAFAAELEELIHYNLNHGTENDDMEMHEIVAETVMQIPPYVLTHLSDHTLARMMLTLGQYAAEQKALGYKIGEREREAGYRLVLAARVPESFANHLRSCEDRLIDAIGAYHFLERHNSNADLYPNQIHSIAKRFLTDFAAAYGMEEVPKLNLFEDKKKSAYSGLYRSGGEKGPGTIDINIAHIQTFADLPQLVLVLGHEALHAYGDAIVYNKADLSMFDRDCGAHFTMLNIFNKMFYSLHESVYPHHAEEKLAEATGVRLAARTISRMGLPLRAKDFQASELWISLDQLEDIFAEEKDVPSIKLRSGGTRLRPSSSPQKLPRVSPTSPG